MMQIPLVGSRIRVVTRHREILLDSPNEFRDTVKEGIVVPSIFREPHTFALQTGNPVYPVSEININNVVSLDVLSGATRQVGNTDKAWKVKSSGKVYLVTRTAGRFGCTCIGFQYHRRCKHIVAVGKLK